MAPRIPTQSPRRPGRLRAGDRVRVRPLEAVAATLNAEGALDGLPFLPEMAKYCGQTFSVRRRVDKLIQEGVGSSMRRIRDVVLLDGTICDGAAHGDCRRACFPLWKTAWLEREGNPGAAAGTGAERAPAPSSPAPNGCQVTALMTATSPLPLWHPSRHLLELRAGTYSVREYIAYLFGGFYRKTIKRLADAIARSKARPQAAGPASPASPPAVELKPGELVEVRSVEEIRATLDAEGRCRGLYFMPGMWALCGRRLRIVQRVDRMMSERTGEMRALTGTYILEGATCDGKAHGGCQRGCYVFWKDAWLKRAAGD
jgi:hypothetical protein